MPEEEEKKEKKEEKEEDDKVVLRVDMHCEACKKKVRKALRSFGGVENVHLDLNEKKVTIKGKVDATKVYEVVKKHCGKRTVLVYPELAKEDEKKNDDKKKEDSPPYTTVELTVKMHCGGCAKQIKKRLLKMDGVMEVNEDLVGNKMVVKGRGLDAEKVCERVKRSGKYCEVVPAPAKKEEEEEEEKKKVEEKKDEKKDEKKEEMKETDESKVEVKKYVYPPYRSVPEYVYPAQLFNDENPNACFVM